MSDFEQLDSVPIEPVYFQVSPSEPIEFGTVAVQFTYEDKTYNATATATLRFSPNDRVLFIISGDDAALQIGPGLFDDKKWDRKLTLTDRGVAIDVLCSAIGGENGGIVFTPQKEPIQVRPQETNILRGTFHLMNCPDFFGPDNYILRTGKPPFQGGTSCGRAILRCDGWQITIAAIDQTRGLVKALKQQGGHVITHAGQIEQEDRSTFSSKELENQLGMITYFLSFVFGRWAGASLSIGVDADGNQVYEEWGLRKAAEGPWNGAISWFDSHHAELLTQVFPGFVNLWQDDVWSGPLRKALYLYLGASEPGKGIGVDTGLILTQAALELLAWNHCVQDRKMVSPRAFEPRGLSAADKLRILAASLDIPLEIPATLTSLLSRPGKKWDDSMDAITALRNSVVHPATKNPVPDNSFYDAWRLSLWYIDLVLLRLCGHTGSYANRLTARRVGTVESVPWT